MLFINFYMYYVKKNLKMRRNTECFQNYYFARRDILDLALERKTLYSRNAPLYLEELIYNFFSGSKDG